MSEYNNSLESAFAEGEWDGVTLDQGYFAYHRTKQVAVEATEDQEAYTKTVAEPVKRQAQIYLYEGLTTEQNIIRAIYKDLNIAIPDSLKTESELNPVEEEEVL